jgi:hypothetical protein
MPNNAKKKVYKEKEFEMYVLWKSTPAYFRGMTNEQLLSHGFSDPILKKIVKIKNQSEFAKVFNIKDLGTLTDWNHKIEKNNLSTKSLEKVFDIQMQNVNEKINSQPDVLLKNKIKELRQEISLLKKENAQYKKQFGVHTFVRPLKKKTDSPSPAKKVESGDLVVETAESSVFLKTVRGIIAKWRR